MWEAVVGEELACQRERENSEDPFAVAVMKGETIVGHVPRRISAVCAMFIRRGGSILCRVTGSRCYSEDLPQGGLEIPLKSVTGTKVLRGQIFASGRWAEKIAKISALQKFPAIWYFALGVPTAVWLCGVHV